MAGYTVDGKNIHTQGHAPQIAMLNYNFWLGFMGDIAILNGFNYKPTYNYYNWGCKNLHEPKKTETKRLISAHRSARVEF